MLHHILYLRHNLHDLWYFGATVEQVLKHNYFAEGRIAAAKSSLAGCLLKWKKQSRVRSYSIAISNIVFVLLKELISGAASPPHPEGGGQQEHEPPVPTWTKQQQQP
jgi:hypothetical protein